MRALSRWTAWSGATPQRRHWIRTVCAYGIIGVLSSAIYFGLAVFFVEIFAIPPTIASALAFVASFLFSFFINHHWVFQSTRNRVETFFRFMGASIFALCLTTFIIYLTVDLLSIPYRYGLAIVLVVIPINNYLINSLWTFSDKK